MKTHLLYPDGDLEAQRPAPWNVAELAQDLELNTLLEAMACGDTFLLEISKRVVLSDVEIDLETIGYRQAIIKDTLRNEGIVRRLYDTAVEAIETEKRNWLGIFSRYPNGILHEATNALEVLTDALGRLRRMADTCAGGFESRGFKDLFQMLRAELTDEYLESIKGHLKELKFRGGVLVSAELGQGNEGVHYVLRRLPRKRWNWIEWIPFWSYSAFTYRIADRDEAGARALGDLRAQGINLVANAAAQSVDHIRSFFIMLRTELAFYLACVNLHHQLRKRSVPVCFPVPAPRGALRFSCVGLRDASLALRVEGVIGNEVHGDGKNLFIITGANQGGKSTFLRSVGVAQLMMQSGMFVVAESFSADIGRSLFTHYKREEDPGMKSGKLDEELSRMSRIADNLTVDSILLFNESFAATNEREGSEIARQIVRVLRESRVKVFFVTHLHDFARGLWEENLESALFLQAERQAEGSRTFKVLPGEPMETSFGMDLYRAVFGGDIDSDDSTTNRAQAT